MIQGLTLSPTPSMTPGFPSSSLLADTWLDWSPDWSHDCPGSTDHLTVLACWLSLTSNSPSMAGSPPPFWSNLQIMNGLCWAIIFAYLSMVPLFSNASHSSSSANIIKEQRCQSLTVLNRKLFRLCLSTMMPLWLRKERKVNQYQRVRAFFFGSYLSKLYCSLLFYIKD
jgi:hypothetical protein